MKVCPLCKQVTDCDICPNCLKRGMAIYTKDQSGCLRRAKQCPQSRAMFLRARLKLVQNAPMIEDEIERMR